MLAVEAVLSGIAVLAVLQQQGLRRCQCGATAARVVLQHPGLLEVVQWCSTGSADSAAHFTPEKPAVLFWAATKLGVQARHHQRRRWCRSVVLALKQAAVQHLRSPGVWPALLSPMRSLCSWEGAAPRLTVHMNKAVPKLSSCATGGPPSGDRCQVSGWHWQSSLQSRGPLGRQHAPYCEPWHVSYNA